MQNDAQILLVGSATGIYAWHSLAARYPLFVSDGPITNNKYIPLEDWIERRADMAEETVGTIFNPDNDCSLENIEYCAYHNILAVQNSDNAFWRIEQTDGDIWAINPEAIFDEATDAWVMPK